MIRTAIGPQAAYNIERVQIIAANNAVFLRVITRPEANSVEGNRITRSCDRWNVDGLSFTLSRRNITYDTLSRSPIMTSLTIDLYIPMNQAIDISFQTFTPPVEGTNTQYSEAFTGTADVAAFPVVTISPVDGSVIRRRSRRLSTTPIQSLPPTNPIPDEPLPPKPKKQKRKTQADFKHTFRKLDVKDDF